MVNVGNSSLTFGRSKTNGLSHSNFYSTDLGRITPDLVLPVYPGDSFLIKPTDLTRMGTPIAPLMSTLYEDRYLFFVPFRLVWSHWEQFLGADDVLTGYQSTYTVPKSKTITYTVLGSNDEVLDSDHSSSYVHSLADYMRVRAITQFPSENIRSSKTTIIPSVNELPLRAYFKIYNDWFRDANIETPILFSIEDSANTNITYGMKPLMAYKIHDLFTDALPSPQMGDAVVLSIGDTAPIKTSGDTIGNTSNLAQLGFYGLFDGTGNYINLGLSDGSGTNPHKVVVGAGEDVVSIASNEVVPVLDVSKFSTDLRTATMLSINELRFAIAMQQYKERDAIGGGNRYYTWLLAHFGVRSSDARLQRSELLLASSTALHMQQVASSAQTNDAPVGYTGAYSFTVSGSHSNWHHFTEHGVIIGIKLIRSENIYPQAIPDFYNYTSKYDFYDPLFAHLGMVDIPSWQVSARKSDIKLTVPPPKGPTYELKDVDSSTYGYYEYGYSMRKMLSSSSGLMNPQNPNSLDYWTLAPRDDTDNAQSLTISPTFLKVNSDLLNQALVAGSTTYQFICETHFDISAVRVMPLHSTPGLKRI